MIHRFKKLRQGNSACLSFMLVATLAAAPAALAKNKSQSRASGEISRSIASTAVTHPIRAGLTTVEYVLPNGLHVFLTENPKAPNVIVSHWVKAGALHEAPGTTGIAHLFEHMMFRPLKKGGMSFFDVATKLSADFNANTRYEATYFYTAVTPDKLKTLLKYESDRFTKLNVTKEMLDMERKAVWSEYSTKFDANPIIDLWFQIYHQGFPGHPFGWTIIGAREDLEKITAEDCNRFFQKYYAPNNTGLFITGNFKSADVMNEVARLYGPWKRGEASTLPPVYSAKTQMIVGEGALPSQAKVYLFGFRTPYQDQSNIKVQALVDYIFFDGNNGLLKKRIVDDKRMAAGASTFNFENDNGMLKAIVNALPSTKTSDVQNEVMAIAGDFQGMSVKDFDTYKKNYYINFSEGLQRNSNLSEFLATSWGKWGNIDLTSELSRGPMNTTKEEVQQFINQYYKSDNFVFVTNKGQK